MPGLPVQVYECHVTGVRENDRVLDATSRTGVVFKRVSYLLPWITASGSGIDVIPKTGDNCLILKTPGNPRQADGGSMAFVIGFKIPTSPEYEGQELGQRYKDLPQGSMVLRARSEDGNDAHLILSAGGSALIGANDACRTLYSPVDSSVTTLFNSWRLNGPGGYVRWQREPKSSTVSYESEYRVNTSKDEGLRVNVKIGAEGGDPFEVLVGNGGDRPYLRVRVDENGEAHIEGESINIVGRASVSIDAPTVNIKKRPVLGQKDPI